MMPPSLPGCDGHREYLTSIRPYPNVRIIVVKIPTAVQIQTRCVSQVSQGLNGMLDSNNGVIFDRTVTKATHMRKNWRL